MNSTAKSSEYGLGHAIYLIVSGFALAVVVIVAPFYMPPDGSVNWSPLWSPPRYNDQAMSEIVTPQIAAQLPVETSIDFIRNSTSQAMRLNLGLHRRNILLTGIMLIASWFFVPAWIDRILSLL